MRLQPKARYPASRALMGRVRSRQVWKPAVAKASKSLVTLSANACLALAAAGLFFYFFGSQSVQHMINASLFGVMGLILALFLLQEEF